ncbi:hypothetical protein [Spiroplasma endosymbiont of Tipula paludosa]|uniref:hypothetical protein n=1 Tax=Spiroplasma endosymbiont of Tipula paludosa TaxID=3066295 RepID=UPI0035C8B32D
MNGTKRLLMALTSITLGLGTATIGLVACSTGTVTFDKITSQEAIEQLRTSFANTVNTLKTRIKTLETQYDVQKQAFIAVNDKIKNLIKSVKTIGENNDALLLELKTQYDAIKSNDTVVVIKELTEFNSEKTIALKYVKALEDYRFQKEKALNEKLAEKDTQITKLNDQIKIYTKQVNLITDLVATFGKEGSLKELKKVKEEAKFEDQVDHIKAEFERIIKEKTKLNTENEANKQEIKDANEALDALQIAIDTGKTVKTELETAVDNLENLINDFKQ